MEKDSQLWLARNRDGDLWLFSVKPRLGREDIPSRDIWVSGEPFCYLYKGNGLLNTGDDEYERISCCLELLSSLFPEVTFENSPQRLVLHKI
jgi:hypothetical protein